MATIVEVHDPAKFDETLAQISAEQDHVIVLFTGVVDPATGINWCPDCENAKPNIEKYVLSQAKGKLIKCIIARGDWMGNPSHPYKTNPVLKVKGVPTLVVFAHGDTIVCRTNCDDDFLNIDLLNMIAKGE